MKIFYCANFLAVLFYSCSGFASILDNSTHLVTQIKTNQEGQNLLLNT